MIALVAASSAVRVIDQLANGALAAWKNLTTSGHGGVKEAPQETSASFASFLSAHGVNGNSEV